MTAKDLLPFFEAVRPTRRGYMARCPAHDDRHPSLSINDGYKGVLVKCWAGCESSAVVGAIGLSMSDLFYDALPSRGHQVINRPAVVDRVALAFNYEMMALDYRLRSAPFFQEIQPEDFSGLAESDQDRLINQAAAAYFNRESAERLEQVADVLRLRAFTRDNRKTTCRLNRVA